MLSSFPSSEAGVAASQQYKQQLGRRAQLAGGQPIGRLMSQALKYPDLVSLAAGFVDNATLPCEATKRSLERLCANDVKLRKSLQYDACAGNVELRDTICQWGKQAWPAASPDIDRVILTAGSNQFLHLLAEAMLNPGDIVIAAAPTYFVFLGTLKGVDARVMGVPADQDGMCMDALEQSMEALASSGQASRLKAIYTVTEFDNPAGSTLSLERRMRLLELVARWRHKHGPLLIISDNAYQLLRFEGEALPPLTALMPQAKDFVVELGTFSKSFSPGIRVGWGVVPAALVECLLEMKSNIDFGSPSFSQALMNEVLTSGEFERHLPAVIDGYRVKRNAMLAALERELAKVEGVHWRQPQGGLYVWLTLPAGMDASESGPFWQRATGSGVLYVPGHYCFPTEGEPIANNTIRLSYGVQSAEAIATGIRRLATALHEC